MRLPSFASLTPLIRPLRRNWLSSTKMATKTPPAEPLVVIFGSTGTGKSDLAVELATRFNGEIINSDAMQMYKGLPIITNKISVEEQRGIPHHLLGNIGLEEETWTVGRFKREASRIISEIRSRGKLPIVVGGTHYYINGLLFEGGVVGTPEQEEEDSRAKLPILTAPTPEILQKLRQVDPVMADRWHPNDRRKISRSLEIYLTTGRRASDIYAEQKLQQEQQEADKPADIPKWTPLLFWVYVKPDPLTARLNTRIDAMLNTGLMTEVTSMHSFLQDRLSSGDVDRSKGIWQSIGFKEFEPFLSSTSTSEKELTKLKDSGLEKMKIATRQYARYQVRWITHKTLPVLTKHNLLERLILFDSTDKTAYETEVVGRGVDITARFLAGDELPDPMGLSDTARDVLAAKMEDSAKVKVWVQKTCDVCKTTVVTEDAWEKHVKGRGHRRAVHSAKRTAVVQGRREMGLVVVEGSGSGSEDEFVGLDFGGGDE